MKIVMKTVWMIILIVVTFGLFCIILPILAFKGRVSVDAFLNITSLVISWPVAITIIALLFFTRFHSAIDAFLRNIRSISFPYGNVQVQDSTTGAGVKKGELSTGTIVLTPQQSKEIEELLEKEKADLEQETIKAYTEVYTWKFSYLNMFYVPKTKDVLMWFSKYSPQTKTSFHQTWQQAIPSSEERSIMLDVLVQYGMLISDGLNFRITEEGYSFLQFIGYIPFAPTQPQSK